MIPGSPVPAYLANYLLVFPESHPGLGDKWAHFDSDEVHLPTVDLEFVRDLLSELTTREYPTANPDVGVKADAANIYAAGFSNGGGMVWQLLNSDLSAEFRGYAAVGKALDPEKARQYRDQVGTDPEPAVVAYIHGTADRSFRPPFSLDEAALDITLPAFTREAMLTRNGMDPWVQATTTQLVGNSANVTEVVIQLFDSGSAAFLMATVINGGHNWPTPTTAGNGPVAHHFDATEEIVDFWRNHAGLV